MTRLRQGFRLHECYAAKGRSGKPMTDTEGRLSDEIRDHHVYLAEVPELLIYQIPFPAMIELLVLSHTAIEDSGKMRIGVR